MIDFPVLSLISEQQCYQFLRQLLHPYGLKCPHGHPLPPDQRPHNRHRSPVMDYRCRQCGAVFNIFTNTIWTKTRYPCSKIVLILGGIARGIPTQRLATELDIDRSHLSKRRPKIQQSLERYLPFLHIADAASGGREAPSLYL